MTLPDLISSWGGPDSNCYVEYTQADSFLTTGIVNGQAWTDASTLERMQALVMATFDIDNNTEFVGGRYYWNQALKVPRAFHADHTFGQTAANSTNWSQSHKRLMRDVQMATGYQALWRIQNGGQNKYQELQALGVKQVSEGQGPVYESVTFAGGGVRNTTLHPQVVAMLGQWKTGKRVWRA